MSLLLDALKKAAEKKAKKDADKSDSVDQTETAEITETQQVSASAQEETEITDTAIVDSTQYDQDTQVIDSTEVDETAFDQTEVDQSEVQTQVDATETVSDIETTMVSDEDSTLLIHEDEDDAVEIAQHEQEDLTENDVTEFLGDGLAQDTQTQDLSSSDDTTITSSETLDLTQYDDEDLTLEKREDTGYPLAEDKTRTQPGGLHGYDGRMSTDSDAETMDQELGEEDATVEAGVTQPVDIDTLTSDETVTVKDSTATRTFAPDNYDRTLLKLSDSDVSKIFPGMKSESTAVMTPDYAKKVFMSKSGTVRTHYFKVYAGIVLTLFLLMAVWGLFQLQDESDLIDRNLVNLKRDPMPGLIKPKKDDARTSLFESKPAEADDKTIDLIARAGDPSALPEESVETGQSVELEAQSSAVEDKPVQAEPLEQEQVTESVETSLPETEADQAQVVIATTSAQEGQPEMVAEAETGSTRLQLSTASRVSETDQLLMSAYSAYDQGDTSQARKLYDEALAQAPTNRDALLGRAAIHVLDSEYQTAIEKYQVLLELNPKDSMAMTSLISVANIDPQVGESQLKSLLRDQPNTAYLHFALGNMYGSQNRWLDAQNAYFKALKFKPEDPNYAYNLAVSLEHLGKSQAAISFYQQAMDNIASGLATFDSQLVSQRIEVLSQ